MFCSSTLQRHARAAVLRLGGVVASAEMLQAPAVTESEFVLILKGSRLKGIMMGNPIPDSQMQMQAAWEGCWIPQPNPCGIPSIQSPVSTARGGSQWIAVKSITQWNTARPVNFSAVDQGGIYRWNRWNS